MEHTTFSSPAIAKEMKRIYGSSAKVVKIDMRHEEEVRKYVMKIEEAHKKAAESKLTFPSLFPRRVTFCGGRREDLDTET